MRVRSVVCVLLAIGLLPAASAAWRGRGYEEPDTPLDLVGGFMWGDAGVAARRIYFTVEAVQQHANANPNLGALGSRVAAWPSDYVAWLGVWRDCNGDGYVGLAETGLHDYRVELLVDPSACPPQTGDPFSPDWRPTHNDGAWVHEMIAIGTRREYDALHYPHAYFEPSTRVWADFGLPTDGIEALCPTAPTTPGVFRSTGGALRYADCHLARTLTRTANAAAAIAGLDELSFADAPPDHPERSGSLLNQPVPYGRSTDPTMLAVFDCDAGPIPVRDETGALPRKAQVPIPPNGTRNLTIVDDDGDVLGDNLTRPAWPRQDPQADPDGSPAGTVQHLLDGVVRCHAAPHADAPYQTLERDLRARPPVRAASDVSFKWRSEQSCEVSTNRQLGCPPPLGGLYTLLGPDHHYTQQENTWWGRYETTDRNPYFSRGDLHPWGAAHVTAYAWVDAGPLGLATPGGNGVYGIDHCANGAPTSGLWECDPARWYVAEDGASRRTSWDVEVGARYNLRDVDCDDLRPAASGPAVGEILGGACPAL